MAVDYRLWVLTLGALVLMATCTQARAADLITGQPAFGTYTQRYLDRQQLRRWQELCRGGGRYQAMSEAYDLGKPNPCNRNPKARRAR